MAKRPTKNDTRNRSDRFPALRRVFAGYLHEDFMDDYGTPTAALDAFWRDANREERAAFATDAQAFLDSIASLDASQTRRRFAALGGAWAAPTRVAIVALLERFGSRM